MNEENNNEVFQCICGKQFNSKRALASHKNCCEIYLDSIGKKQDVYICSGCNRQFKKRTSLQTHLRHCKKYVRITPKKSKYWNEKKSTYICECGKEFIKSQSFNAHLSMCLFHKKINGKEPKIAESKIRRGNKSNFSKVYLGETKFNELHTKSGQSHKNNLKTGKTIHNWCGKKHSEETKRKIRISTVSYLMNVKSSRPRYNTNAILVLEKIAKEKGWNLQHAENGGEFYTGIGYFVDAYDKEKNIVVEYDEKKHYDDVENNILREKDLKRQKEIIEHLHCEFWRYNETTKCLWEVKIN